MLDISTMDRYIRVLTQNQFRIDYLLAEIANAEPKDRELMQLSQRVQKRSEEAGSLIARMRAGQEMLRKRNPQEIFDIEHRIMDYQTKVNSMRQEANSASFKRVMTVIGIILLIAVCIFGLLFMFGSGEAFGNDCSGFLGCGCGGIIVFSGIKFLIPLFKSVSKQNTEVQSNNDALEAADRELQNLHKRKNELEDNERKLEQTLASIEQDYNEYIRGGV